MKVLELARLLAECSPGKEVFIEDADNVLHDFKAEERPDVFDGFDSVYEGGLNLIMID